MNFRCVLHADGEKLASHQSRNNVGGLSSRARYMDLSIKVTLGHVIPMGCGEAGKNHAGWAEGVDGRNILVSAGTAHVTHGVTSLRSRSCLATCEWWSVSVSSCRPLWQDVGSVVCMYVSIYTVQWCICNIHKARYNRLCSTTMLTLPENALSPCQVPSTTFWPRYVVSVFVQSHNPEAHNVFWLWYGIVYDSNLGHDNVCPEGFHRFP
jgi:hypothetical protein